MAAQVEDPLQPLLAAWWRPACPAPASTGHFRACWEWAAPESRAWAWHADRKSRAAPGATAVTGPGRGNLAPPLQGAVTLGQSFPLWSELITAPLGGEHPSTPGWDALGLRSQSWPPGVSGRGSPFLEPTEPDSCSVTWVLPPATAKAPPAPPPSPPRPQPIPGHSPAAPLLSSAASVCLQQGPCVWCPSVCLPAIPPQRNPYPRVCLFPFTGSGGEAGGRGSGERKSEPTYWFQMWSSLPALRSNLIKFPQTARRAS